MLANIVGGVLIVVLSMIFVKHVGGRFIDSWVPLIVGQMIVASLLAYISLHTFGVFSAASLFFISVTPLTLNLVNICNKVWRRHRAISGKYGKEVKWIAELIESGDRKFINSLQKTSSEEIMEAKIICESKEELRTYLIDRVQQSNNDRI